MIFKLEERDENNNITRNANRSDILTLLKLLSADAKLVVLLRVQLLTKVEVRNFPLLLFPRWLSLVHLQLAISLRRVKRSIVSKYQCFCLYDIQYWSVLSQELRFPSQKSFLEEIQVGVATSLFSIFIHENTKTNTVL